MAWYDPRHLFSFFRRNRTPIGAEGEVNPSLLQVARWGHWLQSRVLHIPDRYGLVSSGPPLLQAHQACRVVEIAAEAVGLMISASVMELMAVRTALLSLSMASSFLFSIAFIYVEEVFFNPMRAPDYNWSALNEKMGVVQPAP